MLNTIKKRKSFGSGGSLQQALIAVSRVLGSMACLTDSKISHRIVDLPVSI